MSENQVIQYAQHAIQTVLDGDWASSYQDAQKAYNGGIKVPAITWILGYCYATGAGVMQNVAMAHHYLSECADTKTDSHDIWVDKARGFLCINSSGSQPMFGSDSKAAAKYGEQLYYDEESDFREEALSVLCVVYGDPMSDVFNAQKGAMFIKQALKSADSNTKTVAVTVCSGLKQLITRDIANRFSGNESYSPGMYTKRAQEIWPLVKDAVM